MVDSRATTAWPFDKASETSGEILINPTPPLKKKMENKNSKNVKLVDNVKKKKKTKWLNERKRGEGVIGVLGTLFECEGCKCPWRLESLERAEEDDAIPFSCLLMFPVFVFIFLIFARITCLGLCLVF